jgi:hypothetical protein
MKPLFQYALVPTAQLRVGGLIQPFLSLTSP